MNIKGHYFLIFFVTTILSTLSTNSIFSMESQFETGGSSGSNNHLHTTNVQTNHTNRAREGEECPAGSSSNVDLSDNDEIYLVNKTGKVIFITVNNPDESTMMLVVEPNSSCELQSDEYSFLITPSSGEFDEYGNPVPGNDSFVIDGQLHNGLTYNVYLRDAQHPVIDQQGQAWQGMIFAENYTGPQLTHLFHRIMVLIPIYW